MWYINRYVIRFPSYFQSVVLLNVTWGIVSRLVFEYTVQLQGDIHDCINGINKLQHAEILSLYRYTNMRSKQWSKVQIWHGMHSNIFLIENLTCVPLIDVCQNQGLFHSHFLRPEIGRMKMHRQYNIIYLYATVFVVFDVLNPGYK